MTHFKTLTIISAAIVSIVSTASAGETTFQTVISLDRSTTAQAQYTSIQEQVKKACRSEVLKAGFRAIESTSWVQNKCERQLIERAIKSIKNKDLIALYNSQKNPALTTRQYVTNN